MPLNWFIPGLLLFLEVLSLLCWTSLNPMDLWSWIWTSFYTLKTCQKFIDTMIGEILTIRCWLVWRYLVWERLPRCLTCLNPEPLTRHGFLRRLVSKPIALSRVDSMIGCDLEILILFGLELLELFMGWGLVDRILLLQVVALWDILVDHGAGCFRLDRRGVLHFIKSI